jgi:3-methyladenine DNA glycosylase AlkD
MPSSSRPGKNSPARPKAAPRSKAKPRETAAPDVDSVVAELKRVGTKKTLDGMARYAIPSDKAFGVPVGTLKTLAKPLGRNHELAGELWKTGWYEARMLASFIDDPAEVSPAQMDRWCRDFDNWAICDTVCFHLFDRTPYAWGKVKQWAPRREEFIRRAAFALLWGLTVHDKEADDSHYVEGLVLIEQAATDERNFVKKAVNMALRATGKRNATLNAAAVEVARRLAGSDDPTSRWVGKDALRELTSPALLKRLGGRR